MLFLALASIITSLLAVGNIKDMVTDILTFIGELSVSSLFLGYGVYLFSKRKQGKAFYWDDEGVVIDLRGNKVYWKEIEEIRFVKVKSLKSTVIYPHYTYWEQIRIRHKKSIGTTAYDIPWFLIERPKEYHQNLMKAWEKQQEKKTFK